MVYPIFQLGKLNDHFGGMHMGWRNDRISTKKYFYSGSFSKEGDQTEL